MGCDRSGLLGRLFVQDPETLDNPDWAGHLEECEACRRERELLIRSLAVYRHMERVRADEAAPGPSWEAFSRRLERETRRAHRAHARTPWIYGIAGALLVGAVVGGGVWMGGTEPESPELVAEEMPTAIERQPFYGTAPGTFVTRSVTPPPPMMSRRPLPRHTLPVLSLNPASDGLEMSALSPAARRLRPAGGLRPFSAGGGAERNGPPLTLPVSAAPGYTVDRPGR